MRKLLLVLVIALIFGGVAFATATAEDEGPKEVEFWHGFATGRISERMDAVIAYWESENPDVTVNQVLVPWGEIQSKALTATSAGAPPDVFRGWSRTLADWGLQGALTPLNEYIENDPDFSMDDFFPSVVGQATYNGEILGVSPSFYVTSILFVNDDLLQKAGYDAIPADFYEFKAMLEDIDAQNAPDGPWGFLPWFLHDSAGSFAYALTGKYAYDTTTDTLNMREDPEVYNAYLEVLTWFDEIAERIGREYASSLAAGSGRAGEQKNRRSPLGAWYQEEMIIWHSGSYVMADIDEFAPDINYTPSGVPGVDAPLSGSTESNFYFMPRGVDDPETAWRFLKFFGSEYFMNNFVRYDAVIPSRVNVAYNEVFEDSFITPLLADLENFTPTQMLPGVDQFSAVWNNNVLAMLAGDMTPEEVIENSLPVWEMSLEQLENE